MGAQVLDGAGEQELADTDGGQGGPQGGRAKRVGQAGWPLAEGRQGLTDGWSGFGVRKTGLGPGARLDSTGSGGVTGAGAGRWRARAIGSSGEGEGAHGASPPLWWLLCGRRRGKSSLGSKGPPSPPPPGSAVQGASPSKAEPAVGGRRPRAGQGPCGHGLSSACTWH